jgi:hypothetical protein
MRVHYLHLDIIQVMFLVPNLSRLFVDNDSLCRINNIFSHTLDRSSIVLAGVTIKPIPDDISSMISNTFSYVNKMRRGDTAHYKF